MMQLPYNVATLEWMMELHSRGWLPASRERQGYPTRSEVRRWFDRKTIWIDGVPALSDDPMWFPVESLVFFPKSDRRVTLW